MSDYISREAASADECKHKIKTPFAKIIVEGKAGDPYYSILYFDPTDGKCHIGFGSYRLDYVFRWFEEFEITEPAADVEPVRHGRWNRPYISWFFPLKIRNPYCFCTYCGYPIKPRKATGYCPSCGAKMDLEGES